MTSLHGPDRADNPDPFGGTPDNWTPPGFIPDAEAAALLAIGLEPGTPLTDFDRAQGLRPGDFDLDPPDDDAGPISLYPPERPPSNFWRTFRPTRGDQ